MLIQYSKKINNNWVKSSIRLTEKEYKALILLSAKYNLSPSSTVEKIYTLYEEENATRNFTAYVRDLLFAQFL